jgi:hypothetical protein
VHRATLRFNIAASERKWGGKRSSLKRNTHTVLLAKLKYVEQYLHYLYVFMALC